MLEGGQYPFEMESIVCLGVPYLDHDIQVEHNMQSPPSRIPSSEAVSWFVVLSWEDYVIRDTLARYETASTPNNSIGAHRSKSYAYVICFSGLGTTTLCNKATTCCRAKIDFKFLIKHWMALAYLRRTSHKFLRGKKKKNFFCLFFAGPCYF